MSDLQEQVQAVIDGLVESGAERGMQACVYRNGAAPLSSSAPSRSLA